jgi:hypothetical protein
MRSATGLWSRSGLLALLGSLALVVAVTVATPDPAQDYRRRWDDVAVGSWGELENASVRATSVRLTRSLTTEYGTGLTSEATFVVVTLEGRVRRQRVLFSGVTLHTRDDRRYEPRDDYLTAGLGSTDPGFTRAGTAVFEVPDDRLQGAVLEVDRDAAAFDVYASAVRVDLELDRRSPREPGPLLIPSSSTVTVTR